MNDFSIESLALTSIVFILAYFLGSIPFGILISKIYGLGNLRNLGSGNIGATNVLRTGNRFAALLTLILDASKGFLGVILARYISEDAAIIFLSSKLNKLDNSKKNINFKKSVDKKIYDQLSNFNEKIDDQINQELENSIEEQIQDQVNQELESNIEEQIQDQINQELENNIEEQIQDQILKDTLCINCYFIKKQT